MVWHWQYGMVQEELHDQLKSHGSAILAESQAALVQGQQELVTVLNQKAYKVTVQSDAVW
jgi:hypothetical protein